MSRAALWKQQDKVKEREDRAQFLFEEALEEGRNRARRNKSGIVPLWGPDDGTFHLHPVLLQNAINSPYFQRCCETLPDWNAIIDEIYEQDLRHVQPTSGVGAASAPSTAFCLLLRLLLYRMTLPQLQSTLRHPDSVYIRAVGFLYVRYSCPPEDVLGHIEPHLLESTAMDVEIGGGHKSSGGGGRGGGRPPAAASAGRMTLGEYVRKLFGGGFSGGGGGGSGASRDYYGTPLPRYPTHVEREIRAKVLHYDRIHERATRHLQHPTRLSRDFVVGRNVRALYGDEDNPVQWYDAVIDRVITQDPIAGHVLVHPQFVVTFPEYGNTETVSLGELDVPGGSDSAAPSAGFAGGRRGGGGGMKHGRGIDSDDRHSHGPRRSTDDDRLYDEVVRQERDSAAASSRSGWAARRPPTAKAALTTNTGRYAVPDDPSGRGEDDDRPQHNRHHSSDQDRHPRGRPPSNDHDRDSRLKRSAEDLAVIEEKKRRLLSKYG
jgi:pre-mRNA-splicing factor 38B